MSSVPRDIGTSQELHSLNHREIAILSCVEIE